MNWAKHKQRIEELLHGPPGRRFQEFHQRRCASRSRKIVFGRIALGGVLVVTGILLSMPPLIPGFVVTLIGLALIAAHSGRFARWLDRAECALRRLFGAV